MVVGDWPSDKVLKYYPWKSLSSSEAERVREGGAGGAFVEGKAVEPEPKDEIPATLTRGEEVMSVSDSTSIVIGCSGMDF